VVEKVLKQFPGVTVAADGKTFGTTMNRLLREKHHGLTNDIWYMCYGNATGKPRYIHSRRDIRYDIDKTEYVGECFARILASKVTFPRLSSCKSMLEDIWREVYVDSEENHRRRYKAPVGGTDDVLSALVYGMAYAYWRLDNMI